MSHNHGGFERAVISFLYRIPFIPIFVRVQILKRSLEIPEERGGSGVYSSGSLFVSLPAAIFYFICSFFFLSRGEGVLEWLYSKKPSHGREFTKGQTPKSGETPLCMSCREFFISFSRDFRHVLAENRRLNVCSLYKPYSFSKVPRCQSTRL